MNIYHPRVKIHNNRPSGASRRSRHVREISLSRGYSFFVTQNFARDPRLNHTTNFTRFFRTMSVPGYCIPDAPQTPQI